MLKAIIMGATAIGLTAGFAAPVSAAQIVLSAPSIIGDSGSFDARFAADNIVDRQTGDIYEQFLNGEYWLNPEGRSPSFITIDLGAAYKLGTIQLFNSLNIGDRSTKGFEIRAANSLTAAVGVGASGQMLGAGATTIIAGELVRDTTGGLPTRIAAQNFQSSDQQTAFRYLEFRPLSAINSAYNNRGYGLNEIRVFEAEAPVAGAVPEPATWAMMIGGFGLVGGTMRRRSSRVAMA